MRCPSPAAQGLTNKPDRRFPTGRAYSRSREHAKVGRQHYRSSSGAAVKSTTGSQDDECQRTQRRRALGTPSRLRPSRPLRLRLDPAQRMPQPARRTRATVPAPGTHGRKCPRSDCPIGELARYHRAGGDSLEPRAVVTVVTEKTMLCGWIRWTPLSWLRLRLDLAPVCGPGQPFGEVPQAD